MTRRDALPVIGLFAAACGAILSSIFAHGELQPRPFSPNAKTIYDNRPGAEATD